LSVLSAVYCNLYNTAFSEITLNLIAMFEKKSYKGNLEKRRNTFLIIGFVVTLGLIYAGFELYAIANKPKN